MNRRKLLATVGALAGTAGCLGQSDGPTEDGTATESPPSRGTWDDVGTEAGKLPPAGDAFDGVPCPDLREPDRTVCYHTDSRDEDVVLSAEPEVFDPDRGDEFVESLRFRLGNDGERTVLVNPYDWAIHRRDGSSWTQVAPEGPVIQPLTTVDPGETLNWELPETSYPDQGGDDTYRVDTALSTGVYAFSVTGQFREMTLTETPAATPTDRTAFVALFRLESPVGGAEESAATATETSSE